MLPAGLWTYFQVLAVHPDDQRWHEEHRGHDHTGHGDSTTIGDDAPNVDEWIAAKSAEGSSP